MDGIQKTPDILAITLKDVPLFDVNSMLGAQFMLNVDEATFPLINYEEMLLQMNRSIFSFGLKSMPSGQFIFMRLGDLDVLRCIREKMPR
ncbi:unnamed protein product [Echinostoma caproni]|uniref:CheW-like domain-containing protein n=1 Tax=Echinostoma caproni TaxID=27848 RepID=A0A183B8N7_9TREM|nr:unnamed protein product [Echinostoma caproni]